MATLDDFAKQKADYFKQKRQEQLGQVNAAAQEQQDVIQRRFAALGAQGSGAQFGLQQKSAEQAAAQRRNVEQDILGQQIAAAEPDLARRFAAEQAQLGREFTAAERLAQQQYGSDEAGKARQFQAGQQQAQNLFASSEAAFGRQFSAEERASQNKFLAGESAASRDLQSKLAADDLALKKSLADMQNAKDQQTYELAKKQFDVDLETTNFNKIIALVMAGIPYSVASASIKSAALTTGGAAQPTAAVAENLFSNPGAYSGSIPQAANWSSNLGLGVH